MKNICFFLIIIIIFLGQFQVLQLVNGNHDTSGRVHPQTTVWHLGGVFVFSAASWGKDDVCESRAAEDGGMERCAVICLRFKRSTAMMVDMCDEVDSLPVLPHTLRSATQPSHYQARGTGFWYLQPRNVESWRASGGRHSEKIVSQKLWKKKKQQHHHQGSERLQSLFRRTTVSVSSILWG